MQVSGPSVGELLERLRVGVARLDQEVPWRAFLNAQSRFTQYSYANTLLILEQCPSASAVAGYATWRSLGRTVRSGERAIWIVAPLHGRCRDEGPTGFRRVAVFDVTQTDGEPAPAPCLPLTGDLGVLHLSHLVAAAERIGFSVELTPLDPGLYGDCTYRTRRIRVSSNAAPDQQVKTLAHELAHALMHEGIDDRSLAELEAESVAYVVCQCLGVESKSYSFGYVAAWAGGTSDASRAIRSSCRRIAETARTILRLLGLDDATGDS